MFSIQSKVRLMEQHECLSFSDKTREKLLTVKRQLVYYFGLCRNGGLFQDKLN